MGHKYSKKFLGQDFNFWPVIIWVVILSAILLIFWFQTRLFFSADSSDVYQNFQRHYAFIGGAGDDSLWNGIYENAAKAGEDYDVYVEKFGSNLTADYTKNELLQMAIYASVDGIIVEGDESEETKNLIDQAVTKGIPVVTIMQDSSGSIRQSYVGVNSYNIGQEYGSTIVSLEKEQQSEEDGRRTVLVITGMEDENVGPNLVLHGIRETLNKHLGVDRVVVESAGIDMSDDFAMEEYLRNLFLSKEDIPDYLVCLDALSTRLVYQSVVDYNDVGLCQILGYYDSDTILAAVAKGVLTTTLSIDTKQMGRIAVGVLDDYFSTGYANGYTAVDMKMIDGSEAEQLVKEAGEK